MGKILPDSSKRKKKGNGALLCRKTPKGSEEGRSTGSAGDFFFCLLQTQTDRPGTSGRHDSRQVAHGMGVTWIHAAGPWGVEERLSPLTHQCPAAAEPEKTRMSERRGRRAKFRVPFQCPSAKAESSHDQRLCVEPPVGSSTLLTSLSLLLRITGWRWSNAATLQTPSKEKTFAPLLTKGFQGSQGKGRTGTRHWQVGKAQR